MTPASRALCALAFATWASLSSAAEATLGLSVAGTASNQPYAIAVARFSGDAALDVGQIIENDLIRSGLFKALPRAQAPGIDAPTADAAAALSTMGVRYLVQGRALPNGLRFFLLDTSTGDSMLAFDVPSRPEHVRAAAHQISDMVHERISGIRGLANTKLAYVSRSGSGQGATFQLIVADSDGENPRVVAASREPLMSPAWSPDRRQLAFVGYEKGNSVLYVQTLASGQIRKLSSEKGLNASPAWSPDGRQLAYTLSVDGNPEIYVMDVATGSRRRLTEHPGTDAEPAWSPDGQQIAFTSDRLGQPQIFSVAVGGGEVRQISSHGRQNMRASFSPDGLFMAMTTHEQASYRVRVVNLRDGAQRFLSDGPFDETACFSPNGEAILFASAGSDRRGELVIASLDGRLRMRLRNAHDVREPTWSPFAN